MAKSHFRLTRWLFLGIVALGGCSRQDTECLSSIGRKIVERASVSTAACRQRLDGLKYAGTGSVQDRVVLRLRWEKLLADTPFEVVVNGKEIELKGIVQSAEQRTRAIEVAESTVGVDRVVVSVIVEDKKGE
jgi:osmotically-inducible protein OsmY